MLVIGVALAGAAEPRVPLIAISEATPSVKIFLRVFELVIALKLQPKAYGKP